MLSIILNAIKCVRFLLAIVASFSVVSEAAGDDSLRGVPCQAEGHSAAERMVLSLYQSYSWESDHAIQNQSPEVLSEYFDGTLVRLFERDMNCRIEEEGVCNIDFSVLYFAQDFDISDFRVCAVEKDGRAVDVSFTNMGEPRTIRFMMLQTTDGWRISDLIYNDEASLVEILKN